MATNSLPPGNVATLLTALRSQLGVPYKWAWEKPGQGFDCSGLTQWGFGQIGVKIPRTTVTQVLQGQKVTRDQLQPGDLVFPEFPIHHVQVYSGNGNIIEAPETGKNVREVPIWGFYTARRIVADTSGTSGAQGFTIPGAGDVAKAAAGILIPGLPSFPSLFANSRHFMLRVLEVALGIALISVAVVQIGSNKIPAPVKQTVKTVVKAAAL